jgi:hypothetical protein
VRPPQVRYEKPRVSAFISADIPKILALEPDLSFHLLRSPGTDIAVTQQGPGRKSTRAGASDLSAKRYVYFWVDGIHVQTRLDARRSELVGVIDGVRESAQSWKELLLDLKRRGLSMGPELAVADGALGFWQAIEEVWPKTRGQRCWVHKTANVLNKLPKSQQSKAKRALQEI